MSQYQYTVTVDAVTADVLSISRQLPRLLMPIEPAVWDDQDFQAWNSAQPKPYVLSTAQTQIRALKKLNASQLAGATPAQMGLILSVLLANVQTGVV